MKKVGAQVPFLVVEYKKMEKYLEKQASLGKKLVHVTYSWAQGFTFGFEKTEPQEIRYCIDLTKNKEEEYLELCKESGWEYICSTRKMNFFSTTNKEAIYIQTDLEIEAQLVRKAVYHREIFIPILFGVIALLVASGYLLVIPNDGSMTNIKLYIGKIVGLLYAGYGLFCLVMAVNLYYIVKNRTWYKDKTIKPIFRHMYYPFTLIMISNFLLLLSSSGINKAGFYFFVLLALVHIVMEIVNYIRNRRVM